MSVLAGCRVQTPSQPVGSWGGYTQPAAFAIDWQIRILIIVIMVGEGHSKAC
ncbi:hypothetical protein [uncultured Bradyrhizobium sp.]|uniref:hypothetical protein n=1 Tax=uncultured Bradyrhizobium sp. TaxID=199684 RepID=UPI00260B8BA8|nr:hypothetical protein [uncultured Bradyrhizobium sp.]